VLRTSMARYQLHPHRHLFGGTSLNKSLSLWQLSTTLDATHTEATTTTANP
jgi:hypothetical protein